MGSLTGGSRSNQSGKLEGVLTMTLKRQFIIETYGTYKTYLKARKEDYFAVQYAFCIWLDDMQRNGKITEKHLYNTVF